MGMKGWGVDSLMQENVFFFIGKINITNKLKLPRRVKTGLLALVSLVCCCVSRSCAVMFLSCFWCYSLGTPGGIRFEGGGGWVVSGFCHFSLVSFMGFVTEPWHFRHVLFSREHATLSVLEPFFLFTLLICPLYNLLVLAVLCQFVFVSTLVVPCLVLPSLVASCPVFPLRGSFSLFVLFIFPIKTHSPASVSPRFIPLSPPLTDWQDYLNISWAFVFMYLHLVYLFWLMQCNVAM